MKELKTYRDLFQASLDGYDIEFWSESRGKWVPTIGGWYFYTRDLDKDIVSSSKYRIKLTKPSIDWPQVSEKYQYLARDEDGKVYLYEDRPELEDTVWFDFTAYRADAFKSLKVGNCDWRDSLVERPEAIRGRKCSFISFDELHISGDIDLEGKL